MGFLSFPPSLLDILIIIITIVAVVIIKVSSVRWEEAGCKDGKRLGWGHRRSCMSSKEHRSYPAVYVEKLKVFNREVNMIQSEFSAIDLSLKG